MIRALVLLALWAVLPAPGQVGSVALYTEYQRQPSPVVVQALEEEVDSLMAPEGLRFDWRSLPADGRQASTELAVVTFKGRCEVQRSVIIAPLDHRLGWSYISDGEVLPFADVDCEAVGSYVLKELLYLPAESREKVFGRAVGRVLAHELYHVFARTVHHSAHGVDQPAFSVAELLSDRLVFDDHEPDLHILRLNPATAPKRDTGSPQAGKTDYVRDGCTTCHGSEGQGTRHGPVLRIAGGFFNSVTLAAKLGKSEHKMYQRARSLKVSRPSLAEGELNDLVSFLNNFRR
jgi:hypothetical protein